MAGELNPRQARFVQEYLVDGNATQAAIRAGYSQRGADVQGVRLLGDARIQQAVYEAQQARAQRVQIDQDWVLRRLKEEAEYRDQGATHAARVRALELCGKHLGMFREKVEVSGPEGGAIQHEHRASLTAGDLAEAVALARAAGYGVQGDRGAESVDTPHAPPEAAAVPGPG